MLGQTHGFDVENFVQLIVARLDSQKEKFKDDFRASRHGVGIRHLAIDDLLPESLAKEIYDAFPKNDADWRETATFREKKLTTRDFNKLPKILGEISFAIQDERILKRIEEITEMPQLRADVSMYAGGLSRMRTRDFLNPHIDNSHDGERKMYRRINLLYYVTPDWKTEDGGHLELWDTNVRKGVTLESRFNRLILMETNHFSWHSVSPVAKENSHRCCVSNYYFSPLSPSGEDYFHVTSFQGRPEQFVRRLWCGFDNRLRMGVRKFVKSGVKKKDVFRPETAAREPQG